MMRLRGDVCRRTGLGGGTTALRNEAAEQKFSVRERNKQTTQGKKEQTRHKGE